MICAGHAARVLAPTSAAELSLQRDHRGTLAASSSPIVCKLEMFIVAQPSCNRSYPHLPFALLVARSMDHGGFRRLNGTAAEAFSNGRPPVAGAQHGGPDAEARRDRPVISASKVTGTSVYNTDGEHLGEIHDVMLDKSIGKDCLRGDGVRRLPRHWRAPSPPTLANLKYDTRQEGYVVGLTIDQLKGGPAAAGEVPTWGDRAYESRIHDYSKTAPYWGV